MELCPHILTEMWGRVWTKCFRKVWLSFNFYKEYLFRFETLIFVTLQILYMHKQLHNTLKIKKNKKLHQMTPLRGRNLKQNHGSGWAAIRLDRLGWRDRERCNGPALYKDLHVGLCYSLVNLFSPLCIEPNGLPKHKWRKTTTGNVTYVFQMKSPLRLSKFLPIGSFHKRKASWG